MSAKELKERNLKFLKLLVFLVLSLTIPEPPQIMSSSPNYRPFLSAFRRIPPQESFVQLANKENGRRRGKKRLFGQNWAKIPQVDVRTLQRRKNAIWDQFWLLRLKLSRLKLHFRFACKMQFLLLFTFEGNIQCAKKGIKSGLSHRMR